MRDIRDDLRERLAGLRQERDRIQAQLQAKLNEIAAYEEQLNALLKMEERRAVSEPQQPSFSLQGEFTQIPPDVMTSASPKDQLESVILVLLEGGATVPHSVIKEKLEAAGFGNNHRFFGRMLQGTLMSMRGRELIDLIPPGQWRRRMAKSAGSPRNETGATSAPVKVN